MYSNEYLEHWGTVYVTARLLEQGMSFHKFLEDPRGCLKAVGFQSVPLSLSCGYRPLLPRQIQLAQGLWRRWEPETDRNRPATATPNKTPTNEDRHP